MRHAALGCLLVGALSPACSKPSAPPPVASATPSASAPPLAAPVASGLPDPAGVSATVNPDAERAYAGPVGTVRGRIVATGDAAPDLPQALAKIPAKCPESARTAYGKVFREGPGRALADVLVAVTGYKGYVPERSPAVRVEASGCFFGTRTLVLTYGQRIDVISKDQDTYVPELLGEHGQPQMLATPGSDTASPVYPTRPGRYVLIDNLKLFMAAEVLVVKFATHAVTGLDGRFEIPGVPVGQVNVNALLPLTGGGAQKTLVVEAGKPSEELVLEVPFDLATYSQRPDAGAPVPSASAPVAPAKPAPSAKSPRPPLPSPRPAASP